MILEGKLPAHRQACSPISAVDLLIQSLSLLLVSAVLELLKVDASVTTVFR